MMNDCKLFFVLIPAGPGPRPVIVQGSFRLVAGLDARLLRLHRADLSAPKASGMGCMVPFAARRRVFNCWYAY